MIEKKFLVDGQEIPFRTSAALPRLYRQFFGSDVFIDLNNIRTKTVKSKKGKSEATLPPEALLTIENLAYTMAKHADPSIPDDVNEWLGQFSTTAIYMISQEIMLMWNEEQKTSSVPKNQARR